LLCPNFREELWEKTLVEPQGESSGNNRVILMVSILPARVLAVLAVEERTSSGLLFPDLIASPLWKLQEVSVSFGDAAV